MSDHVVIDSSQGGRSLELSAPVHSAEGLEQFTVTVRAEGVTASRGVYAFGEAEALQALFEQMAADWRGWDDTREWGSLEGEFVLTAAHDGVGTVTLRATLWHYVALEWTATVELTIDAGEQLKEAAAAIRRFVHAT